MIMNDEEQAAASGKLDSFYSSRPVFYADRDDGDDDDGGGGSGGGGDQDDSNHHNHKSVDNDEMYLIDESETIQNHRNHVTSSNDDQDNSQRDQEDSEEKDRRDKLTEWIYEDLMEDVVFGLTLQMHRAIKLDYLSLVEPLGDTESNGESGVVDGSTSGDTADDQYRIYNDADVLGVFSSLNETLKATGTGSGRNGQSSAINNLLNKYECTCPNCGRRGLAATRFAPHLEKCMGMGRSSSRAASRRIANYSGDDYLVDHLIESSGLLPNHQRYFASNSGTSSGNASRISPELANNSSSSSNNHNSNSESSSVAVSASNAANTTTANPDAIRVSSSSSSLIDVDVSSSSSSCSLSTNNMAVYNFSDSNNNTASYGMKQPAAKKKRLNNNKSLSFSSSGGSGNSSSNSHPLISAVLQHHKQGM